MRRVVLHGALARDFIPEITLDVRSAAEAARALEANFPGFYAAIRAERMILVAGDVAEYGRSLSEDMLHMTLGPSSRDFHIIPVAEGAGGGNKKGFFQILLGAALIAATVFTGGAAGAAAFTVLGTSVSWGSIAMMGASMLLSGVASVLSPTPKVSGYEDRNSPDERASTLFRGAVNVTEPGAAVPVVYGRFRVGSVVLSGALVAEDTEETVEELEKHQDARYRPRGVNMRTDFIGTNSVVDGEDVTFNRWDFIYTVTATIPKPSLGQELRVRYYDVSDTLLHTDQGGEDDLPFVFEIDDSATGVHYILVDVEYPVEDDNGVPVVPEELRTSNVVRVNAYSDTEEFQEDGDGGYGDTDDSASPDPDDGSEGAEGVGG